MKRKSSAGKMGRPRSFDTDEALEAALRLFREKGYEGASLSELTAAMRINRPSLYAAFGDKQTLFRRALERYVGGPAAYFREALAEPTARRVAERLLCGGATALTDPAGPRGCLLVQGALACGEEASPIRQELGTLREQGVAAIRRRFKRAKAKGDLPSDASPADLARFIATVLHGMSVQAASGASRSDLQQVAQIAMRAWPK